MKNIRMNHVSGGKYEILHPETNTAQIVDISTGKTLEQLIQGGDLGGSGATSLSNVQFPLVSTVDKQTDFPFNDALFSVTDIVKVYINGEFLYPEEYSVDTSGVLPKIVLVRQLPVGTHVLIDVWRNVLTEGVGAVSGSGIDVNALNDSIVLESGTNTNGRYIKYGDGRLECYMTINIESTIDSGITSIWTFPHIFTPDAVHGYVDLFCNVKSVTSNIDGYDNLSIGYTTNNAPAQAVIRFNSTANQKLAVSCMAIGRWK